MTEPAIRRPSASDIQRAMQHASSARKEASEASGEHGNTVKTFCDDWGVERKAFTWNRSLYEAAPEKRQGIIRDFLEISGKLGFLDQRDMFDDLGEKVVNLPPRNAAGQTVEEVTAAEQEEGEAVLEGYRDSAA